MGVYVKYRGRMGNRMFQYAFGRLLAEHYGMSLHASPIQGFPGTSQAVEGRTLNRLGAQKLTGHSPDLSKIDPDRAIVLDGFFQDITLYEGAWPRIKAWFDPPDRGFLTLDPDHLVVSVRRGDFVESGRSLSADAYDMAIWAATAGWRRLAIVTDDPSDPFHDHFRRSYSRSVTIYSGLDDFEMLANATQLVLSHSTFAWWAAMLGSPSEVIVPVPDGSPWSESGKTEGLYLNPHLDNWRWLEAA